MGSRGAARNGRNGVIRKEINEGQRVRCARCQGWFPVESIERTNYRAYCRDCYAKLAVEWQKSIPQREGRYRRVYGLSLQSHAGLFLVQEGRCAICKDEAKTAEDLVVDHDHGTGAVRGLLCANCNSALGLFKDDPRRLLAADYLLGQPPSTA